MIKQVGKAKRLCAKLRYRGDAVSCSKFDPNYSLNGLDSFINESGLLISKDLTPILYKNLCKVYKLLQLSPEAVEAYVYASPEIQAQCLSVNRRQCIIRFSSSLVDILEPEEFRFVAAHELGHFLLDHGTTNLNYGNKSLEFSMQQRAQEISSDRVGYLASESLDVSVKTLMKTISGLSSRHLRFDVSKFLKQLKEPSQSFLNKKQYSSHPSILFRCRALLWFSMKIPAFEDVLKLSSKEKTYLDNKIDNDMEKFIDGAAKNVIKDARNNLAMWILCNEIVQDNKFDKKEQEFFSKEFGNQKLEKMINFLDSTSVEEAKKMVRRKLQLAKKKLKSIIPNTYEKELNKINSHYRNKY